MTTITIIDRPCGWGKTTKLFTKLQGNQGPFLVVVPLLSECERVVEECQARGVPIVQAGFEEGEEVGGNKTRHVRSLLRDKKNIICTHALYSLLGTLGTEMVPSNFEHQSSLACYTIYIDEVINPFNQYDNITDNDFRKLYIEGGFATVQKDGLILPTEKWDILNNSGVRVLSRPFYMKCKASSLYYINEKLFILTVPLELLTKPKAVNVLTFLSEGSFFLQYVRKLIAQGINIELKIDALEAPQLNEWKRDVRGGLTISTIHSLEKFKFNHSGQTKFRNKFDRGINASKIGNALRKFRERDPEFGAVAYNNTMLTCVKSNWFSNKGNTKPTSSFWSKDSRMFGRFSSENFGEAWQTTGVNWVANQTRGTNLYSDCTHAIYLYDQNPNPQVTAFLGWPNNSPKYRKFADAYALTELVQWLFRCQIRKGGYGLNVNGVLGIRGERQKATAFIPSERMRKLLIDWLNPPQMAPEGPCKSP